MLTSKSESDTLLGSALQSKLGHWAWPIFFTTLVIIAGAYTYYAVRQSARSNVESKLTAILETEVKALSIWIHEQQRTVAYFSDRDDVRAVVLELLRLNEDSSSAHQSPQEETASYSAMETLCLQTMGSFGYIDYHLLTPQGRIVAAADGRRVGQSVPASWSKYLPTLAAGQAIFAPPAIEHFAASGVEQRAGEESPALLIVAAPVYDARRQIVATIAFGIHPEQEFTGILSVARSGESGETYAFDSQGWLISDSRFDQQFDASGRLREGANDFPLSPALQFQLHTPGQNDLTDVVRSALRAHTRGDDSIGLLLDGYQDYRGGVSVGAYQWLSQYDFGVVTRLDYQAAYAPSLLLRNLFAGLFLIALVAATVNIINTQRLARFQSRVAEAEQKVRKLGQYTLQEKIGEGSMGEVYRATHAMLRRPTAVKLLRPGRSSELAIARFELEVQMTALLTHPNTVAIYDYGRTPDGTFYYAMEFLDGVDLNRLVKHAGPQPDGRVVAVLRQVCNSLTEAHEAGLNHRDIKPANVILLRRGRRADIVKLLDFGLVHDVQQREQVVDGGALAGTPAFMSPESFQTPHEIDARSDLYAVGALGYFLLTGNYICDGKDIASIAVQHAQRIPIAPSDVLGRPVDSQLSALVMQCLEKSPADRPSSAAALSKSLRSCASAASWTQEAANRWWDEYSQHAAQPGSTNANDEALSSAYMAATITHFGSE